MSDKILKIKLEVDTGQAAKLVKITDDLAKQSNTQLAKSKELLAIEAKVAEARNAAVSSLSKVIIQAEQYNNFLKQGGTVAYLAKAGLDSYNSKLLETQNNLKKVIAQQGSLASSFAFASGQSKSASAIPEASGLAQQRQNQLATERLAREKAITDELTKQQQQLLKSTSSVAEATGTAQQRQQQLYEQRLAREATAAQINAEKVARLNESIAASSNRVLESQTKSRLLREAEESRLAAQRAVREQSFSQRLNSVPRVTSQGSQIDITGTLSKYLKDQAIEQEVIKQKQLKQSILETNKARVSEQAHLATVTSSHRNLVTTIIEGVSIYRVYNTVLNSFLNAIQAIPSIGIQFEATKSVLLATEGSTTGVVEKLRQLEFESSRVGTNISTLRENFRNFSASTKLAGESADDTWRIFTNLNTVSTALHLTADQTQHVFNALAQIFNKGKVQSEELVKQLGNLLPGAFAAFAKANEKMFANTQELIAQMKKGAVFAHDTVKNFTEFLANQFNEAFLAASQGVNANLERMKTSFTLLGETIYRTVSTDLISALKTITDITNNIKGIIDGTNKYSETIKNIFTGIKVAAEVTLVFLTSVFAVKLAALVVANPVVAGLLATATAFTYFVGKITRETEALDNARTGLDKYKEGVKQVREEQEKLSKYPQLKLAEQIDASDAVKPLLDLKNAITEALDKRVEAGKQNSLIKLSKNYEIEIAKYKSDLKELDVEIAKQRNIETLKIETTKALEKQANPLSQEDNIQKEAAIKEVNFNKELAYQKALIKQEDERFKAKLENLKLEKETLDFQLKQNAISTNPVADKTIKDKINSVEQQTIVLQQQHQQALLNIAKDSENIIIGSVKKTTVSVQQAFKAIQEIESAGVKTRGGREGAVSITGALGKSQVQPSTLNDFTGNVPSDILAIEKKAKFNLNVLKKKVTLEPAEIERLRDYALANVKSINGVGEKLFTKLVEKFGGDFVKAAVAYNTGASRVEVASTKAKQVGRNDFEAFLPTSGKLGLNPRALAEAQGYAKKARSAIGGDSFEPALLEQQTKQQEAFDAQRNLAQEKFLLDKQKEYDLNLANKELKEEEIALNIDEASTKGLTLQAEQLRIKADFEKKSLEYIQKGADAFIPRLEKIKQEKLIQAQIADIKNKYQQEEERYNASLEDITKKSQLKYLNTQESVSETVKLQAEHLRIQGALVIEWEKQAKLSGDVRDNIEAENAARERTRQLIQTASILAQPLGPLTQNVQQRDVELGKIDLGQIAAQQLAVDELRKNQQNNVIESEQIFQDKLANIEDAAVARRTNVQADYYGTLANFAASSFADITTAAVQMYGAQSEAARIAFAAQKAFSAGEAIITGIKATQDAYAAGMSTGGPTAPAFAVAFASISAVATAARVAAILAQPVPGGGAAHGGLENVPKEQTYLLDKGERVLSPRQNVDITNKVTNIHDKISGQQNSQPNIRIVNVMDENLVYNALGSDQSERIIMNIVNRNK